MSGKKRQVAQGSLAAEDRCEHLDPGIWTTVEHAVKSFHGRRVEIGYFSLPPLSLCPRAARRGLNVSALWSALCEGQGSLQWGKICRCLNKDWRGIRDGVRHEHLLHHIG